MCIIHVDTLNRTIRISGDYDIVAHHNGEKIGELQFSERDERAILYGMDVKEEYRRAGIATAMMRYAVTIHGADFGKPDFTATGCEHAPSETYYTQEGAAFIRSCIERHILEDTETQDKYDDNDLP